MGSIYAKKGRLYLSYKDAEGKWRSRAAKLSVGEEEAAKKRLAALESEVGASRHESPFDGRTTVAEYCKHWLELRKVQGIATAVDDESRMRLHILPELGERAMGGVRPRHVRDLVRRLQRKRLCSK